MTCRIKCCLQSLPQNKICAVIGRDEPKDVFERIWNHITLPYPLPGKLRKAASREGNQRIMLISSVMG
ncbi:MAG: hypothetical protein U5L00_04485 [Desulfovermiculus sp.]|nr:hypothetical protein [Desulfovermiculus sp.]